MWRSSTWPVTKPMASGSPMHSIVRAAMPRRRGAVTRTASAAARTPLRTRGQASRCGGALPAVMIATTAVDRVQAGCRLLSARASADLLP